MAKSPGSKRTGPGDVFDVLDRLGRRLRQIRRETLRVASLTPASYYVLSQLWRQDGRPLKDLADDCGCTRATITGIVDSLEKGGFVVRVPNPDDRRSLLAQLTRKGRALKNETPDTARLFDCCCDGLAQEELDQLHGLLSKLADSLGETRSCASRGG